MATETLTPPVPLEDIYRMRSELDEFKLRDQAYQVYEAAYLGRSTDKKQQYLTWRPQMMDSAQGDTEKDKALINLCRQINNHHQASFARAPRTWCVPYSADAALEADKKTSLITGILRRSRIKSIQPLLSWRLTNRGDAIIGMEWSNSNTPFINIRAYDPAQCYPDLDNDDIGGMYDLLIRQEVRKEWAERTYNIEIGGQDKSVSVFTYWTPSHRYVSVGKHSVGHMTLQHDLGFVPWRWVFNSPNGHMAQSDIAEIPKLQQLLSDMFTLSMDAARKRVDKAYWGKGISGNVIPKPGQVVTFPNPNAQINEFPTADPPEMLFAMMNQVQQYAQGMGGISPISMEGLSQGSNVTGSAVRHQVEAIEARTETKRVSIEHAYSILGEYVLRILEAKFPEQELVVQTDQGEVAMSGPEVKSWYTCEASYGGFEGMGPMERGRWALEGLGRIHGSRKAISIAYPDEDVQTMEKEIDDFQIRQAAISAQAQVTAQAIQSGGGGGAPGGGPAPAGGTPGGPPGGGQPPPPIAMNQPPPQPGQPQLAQAAGGQVVQLSELESLINVVRPRLKGQVWAVGELAVAGQSATPRVMCEDKDDVGNVTSVLQAKKVRVSAGTPGDGEPKVSLL